MSEAEVYVLLKAAGVCGACVLRHLGYKSPEVYSRQDQLIAKFEKASLAASVVQSTSDEVRSATVDQSTTSEVRAETTVQSSTNEVCSVPIAPSSTNDVHSASNGDCEETSPSNGSATNGAQEDGPASKRRRWSVCVCCLGVLQRDSWEDTLTKVKEALQNRGYDCQTFACALSAPVSIILRERALALHLKDTFPQFSLNLTPLKEAWKWTLGPALAAAVGKRLDSGAVSPLLVTVNVEYDNDMEELETLKCIAPSYYENRSQQSRKFPIDFTRRSVEAALEAAGAPGEAAAAVARCFGTPPPAAALPARTVSVTCSHAPVYLAGRYTKLSRELSQTPWLVDGKRMMESSVAEVIFGPVAKFYRVPAEDVDRRLKLVAAGREDVDVRCLGAGRPFAVEVADPHIGSPDEAQLRALCEEISAAGSVRVDRLQMVSRDDLAELKKGEESKTKTYAALCIKLPQGVNNLGTEDPAAPTRVTDADIDKIRALGTSSTGGCCVELLQRTPLRVLHRRPLHARRRKILQLDAEKVEGHPNLFTLTVRTEAGTYIKEFVHGDFGRTRPCLRDVIGADVDILALDVTGVELEWPPSK